MNARHIYDEQLELIIEQNENQNIVKPSYLDFNYPDMKPININKLSGYEKTIALYHQHYRKKIKALNEEDTMDLLKFIFPDIYKIEVTPPYDRIDFHVPSYNLHIEHKKRTGMFFDGMTLDKPKYDDLIKEENPYFLNSTPIGLFIWNLRLLGELEWVLTDKSPRGNTGHKRHQTETNYITYLPYEKCNDLTYLLLQYT